MYIFKRPFNKIGDKNTNYGYYFNAMWNVIVTIVNYFKTKIF